MSYSELSPLFRFRSEGGFFFAPEFARYRRRDRLLCTADFAKLTTKDNAECAWKAGGVCLNKLL